MLNSMYHLFMLAGFLALATACPCSFKDEPLHPGEVTCDPGTQDMLPFALPSCLSSSVTNNQVKRLILTDQNFPHLVLGSFSLFPNLERLDLSYCNIGEVDPFTFEENPRLKSLILNGNYLKSLPSLFESSSNSLQSLTIGHNKLESLDATHLDNLVSLEADDNALTEDGVSEMMAFLPSLYEVSLDSNLISRVKKPMFQHQEQINKISLWNNKISDIETGSFDHLLNVRSIDLQSNSLSGYQTEAWHFCHSLNQETLDIKMDTNKQVTKDLKVDTLTASYCAISSSGERSVAESCSNEEGHLSCKGMIEDLVCELQGIDFESVTFLFQKDEKEVEVADFFEAETNSYFKEINQIDGKSNITKYLSDLKLYGTKFDLADLEDHLGPTTEKVTIFADTVHMSRPLESPIKSKIYVRARVVSISEDIPMKMTKQQFFQPLETDQSVDNWASVQEVISSVGNVAFSVRKLGFIEVQQQAHVQAVSTASKGCSPRTFSVQEYEVEHHTPPSVFFDRVQMNLLRMAVRTLGSTRSNDALALTMADHTLAKTTDPTIIEDKMAYRVAQKLIRDREILASHKRNVPFYSTKLMEKLAAVMYDNMRDYASNETNLILKLDISLGRMADMNKNFEEARLGRELYFERELQTLEEIWNSTDTAWHWTFNASRDMESSIQDSIKKNGEEMFQMEQNELEEMLARAQDTVKSDKAVVDKYKEEIERYSVEVKLSLELQRQKLKETKQAGYDIETAKKEFDDQIEEWKEEQLKKAFFGFLTAFIGIAVGIATMQPEIAGAGIAAGAAEAGAAGAEIAEIMGAITELISALADLEEMLDAISDVGDIDVSIPDLGSDIALGTAVNWRGAIENAYYMKNMTSKFDDVEILGQTKVASVGRATDNGVDPANMQQALTTYTDRGTQLISETVNFAQLLMHLADLAGELEVAEQDLEIAIEQVERVRDMLGDLKKEHDNYVNWMNEHRDEYQDKCDDFAEAYETASNATKEEFKKQIIERFDRFKHEFELSNTKYVTMMNALTGALYAKVASVKQHSMVQRSLIMNLYQDYCDGLFYFSFTECDKNDAVPTMSDDFGTLLEKLNEIRWDSITSWENLPNPPEIFRDVTITLMDQRSAGFNSSAQLFGPVTSLRNTQEVFFNLKEHDVDNFFDQNRHYRIRLDTIRIHLLDEQENLIPSKQIKFNVYFPLEFNDTDKDKNVYSFRAMKFVCSADYSSDDGVITQNTMCEVVQEFEGVHHKTSHDGVFRIDAMDTPQEVLDQVGVIKITVSGNFVTKGKKA